MNTTIHDINPTERLMLIEDEGKVSYAPLEEGAELSAAPTATYLKQLHYVARARTSGLFVTSVQPMLPGWVEYDRCRAAFPEHFPHG
jgi:hypothetical protein